MVPAPRPKMELVARLLQAIGQWRWHLDEYFVGLYRIEDLRAGQPSQPCGKRVRRPVGPAGQLQPQVVLEIGLQLNRHEAHLAEEMPGALVAASQTRGSVAVEDHHRLGSHGAVLGGPEGKDVDSGLPGQLGGCATQSLHGIGEASAIHVQPHSPTAGNPGNLSDLIRLVDGSQLGRLAEADGAGLTFMDPHLLHLGQGSSQGPRADLGQFPGQWNHLGAPAVELGAPALVGMQVGLVVTEDGTVGGRQLGDGQGVGRRTRRNREDLQVCLEGLPKAFSHSGSDPVLSVSVGVTRVGLLKSRQDFGRRRRFVVAAKIHRAPLRTTCE